MKTILNFKSAKILAICLTVLLVAGCDFMVYSHEIKGYEKACDDKGGIVTINNITRRAQCMDGTRVRWLTEN